METSTGSPVIQTFDLGTPWRTFDPFLFCVHHNDAYPAGDGSLAPAASLAGRQIGADFSGLDGWSMYHGDSVPGFPQHPHRGFETVTFVRRGYIDHADSLRAKARYGAGDTQWLTAGAGIVHAEMFPLLRDDAANPAELFQIWLNLPARHKMVPAHFTMLWSEKIPRQVATDEQGRATEIAVIAGQLIEATATKPLDVLSPPPDSWASQPDADVAIWTIRMAPGARWTLPAAAGLETNRQLYFFKGASIAVAGQLINSHAAIELSADTAVELVNHASTVTELLLLQGKPIGEPVAQYGPFVMNTQAEIAQAIQDYQRTQFGGWPWPSEAPVHGRDPARFVRQPGEPEERPAG